MIKKKPSAPVQLAWFLIPVLWASGILFGQFRGEDEALTLRVIDGLISAILTIDPLKFTQILYRDWHPPGRSLLAMPFVAIFGHNLIALRLPNLILWGATVLVAGRISFILAGSWSGWFTVLFLSLSGLYQLQAMGFGLAMVSLTVSLVIQNWVLKSPMPLISTDSINQFKLNGVYIFLGFIFFTTSILIAVPYYTYYLYLILNGNCNYNNIKLTIKYYLPLILPYVIYYFLFILTPIFLFKIGAITRIHGQAFQNYQRLSGFGINFDSFLENLMTLNWYFLPIIGNLFIFTGCVILWRNNRKIFILIVPFYLFLSLIMSGKTGAHSMSFFIWVTPFVVSKIFVLFNGKKKFIICLILLVFISCWSYILHVRPYHENNYPFEFSNNRFFNSYWKNNLYYPLDEIKSTLNEVTVSGKNIYNSLDGSYILEVAPDANWVFGKMIFEGDCIDKVTSVNGVQVDVILYNKNNSKFCGNFFDDIKEFEGTNIKIGFIDKKRKSYR
jgi:hypothetical protein